MEVTNAVLIVTTLLPSMLVEVVIPIILLVVIPVVFIKDNIR